MEDFLPPSKECAHLQSLRRTIANVFTGVIHCQATLFPHSQQHGCKGQHEHKVWKVSHLIF
jgi:hypothetical protein